MFGARLAERVPRMIEGLEMITRLWAGETLDGTGVSRWRPAERPAGPTAEAADLDRRPVRSAIERAAVLRDGWVASANATMTELAEKIGWFKAAANAAGTRGEVILMRDGFVAETYDEARRIAAGPMLDLYAEYAGWKRDSPDAARCPAALRRSGAEADLRHAGRLRAADPRLP